MRIQVIRLLSDIPKQPLVEFQSAYGIGRAHWAGNIPQLFTDYNVEFEIPEMLIWDETIISHDEGPLAVTHQENALLLSGKLESIDEYNICYVRIGESIILVEVAEKREYNPTPCFVRIASKQAILYDIQF